VLSTDGLASRLSLEMNEYSTLLQIESRIIVYAHKCFIIVDWGPCLHAALSAISHVPPMEILMEWHEGEVIKNL